MAAVWRSGASRQTGRLGAVQPNLVFVMTFGKMSPGPKNERKTLHAILYNLREKSGPKLKN
jgi:hypothetical protein